MTTAQAESVRCRVRLALHVAAAGVLAIGAVSFATTNHGRAARGVSILLLSAAAHYALLIAAAYLKNPAWRRGARHLFWCSCLAASLVGSLRAVAVIEHGARAGLSPTRYGDAVSKFARRGPVFCATFAFTFTMSGALLSLVRPARQHEIAGAYFAAMGAAAFAVVHSTTAVAANVEIIAFGNGH